MAKQKYKIEKKEILAGGEKVFLFKAFYYRSPWEIFLENGFVEFFGVWVPISDWNTEFYAENSIKQHKLSKTK